MTSEIFTEPPILLDLLPQRPGSARVSSKTRGKTTTRRPATARSSFNRYRRQQSLQHAQKSSILRDDVALTEASLRETQQVAITEPILHHSVEIQPQVLSRPHGIRNAEYFHSRGFNLRIKGDYEGAIKDYHQALKRNPKDFKSCFNIAVSYDRIGKLNLAMEFYKRASLMEKSNAYVYYNMACVEMKQRNAIKAVKSITLAIQLEPTNIEFFKTRGMANRLAGRFTQSASDYVHAKSLESTKGHKKTAPNVTRYSYESKAIFRPKKIEMNSAQTHVLAKKSSFEATQKVPEDRKVDDINFIMDVTNNFPVCRAFAQELHYQTSKIMIGISLPAHTVVFRQNNTGGFVYFIIQGSLSIQKTISVSLMDVKRAEEEHEGMGSDDIDIDEIWNQTYTEDLGVDESSTTWERYFIDRKGSDLYRSGPIEPSLRTVLRKTYNHGTEICLLTAGDEFGKQGMFRNQRRQFSAITTEPTQLLAIPWTHLHRIRQDQQLIKVCDYVEYFASLPLFRGVSLQSLKELASIATPARIETDKFVLAQGQKLTGVIFICKGGCRLVRTNAMTVRRARRGSEVGRRQSFAMEENADNPLKFLEKNKVLWDLETVRKSSVYASKSGLKAIGSLRSRDYIGAQETLGGTAVQSQSASVITDMPTDILYVKKVDLFKTIEYKTRQMMRRNLTSDDRKTRQVSGQERRWQKYKDQLISEILGR